MAWTINKLINKRENLFLLKYSHGREVIGGYRPVTHRGNPSAGQFGGRSQFYRPRNWPDFSGQFIGLLFQADSQADSEASSEADLQGSLEANSEADSLRGHFRHPP